MTRVNPSTHDPVADSEDLIEGLMSWFSEEEMSEEGGLA